jgi:anti-sigma factor RsiW
MNDNTKAQSPDDAATPRGCARSEELVTYLYGESTPKEARAFARHLDTCHVCREEFAAFAVAREGLAEWRAEVLGTVPSLDIQAALAPLAARDRAPARRPSAAAALREFFSFSPLWLRAGALAATLAISALLLLTLARAEVRWDSNGLAFRAGVAERVVVERVNVPTQTGYTQEQLETVVAERLKEAKARWEADSPRPQVVNVSDDAPKRSAPAANRPNPPRTHRATPRAPERDEELADLPRLSDLLNGSY